MKIRLEEPSCPSTNARALVCSALLLSGLLLSVPAFADEPTPSDAATLKEPAVQWTFRNHVQPVLAKAGCSAGACHGAAAGQNGFKLSLRGFDDEGDYMALTHNALGRRIVPTDPGRSLLLLKPTGAIPHKGGKRFDTDSLEYRILSEWIASGTPGPRQEDPRIVRIETSPAQASLKPGATEQLVVRAYFDNGRSEDVTRWAKFTDANAAVTQVDELGKVTVLGYGEGAITAWYLSKISIATVTAPYDNKIATEIFAKAPRRNFIDELVLEKLQRLNLAPSPQANDSEFLRRAYLDTIGVLPSAKEAREFLADTSAKKRDRLIDQLLKRPSSSIIGPTNGLTCSWLIARSCPRPPCGRTTTGFATR